jgi:hypothetical protein
MPGFDYEAARKEGYSDDEILDYIAESSPNFDAREAVRSGYTPQEVAEFAFQGQDQPEERSPLQQAGRALGNFGLGMIEAKTFPYDIAVAASSTESAQLAGRKEALIEGLDDYLDKVSWGLNTPEEDARFESMKEELNNPSLAKQRNEEAGSFSDLVKKGLDIDLPKIDDYTVSGLIEKATGLDLKPEGILENAARWTGFIKDPRKIFELKKTGLNLKDLTKAIAPTGTEALRGAGAGAGLELAKRGDYGPIGTMAAAVIGDIIGHTTGGIGKAITKIVSDPKQALAEVSAKFSNKDKANLQQKIIKEFRDAGVSADLGTITGSNLVKWMQSRLAQSGLTGKALEELKDTITKQVSEEYRGVAESVGKSRFVNTTEAGEVLQETVTKIRDQDLKEVRDIYKTAKEDLRADSTVADNKTLREIKHIQRELRPGRFKSPEQQKMFDVLNEIQRDVSTRTGEPILAPVRALMNDKIALNDIIDYEVQGGVKQLLKNVVKALDRDIISYGKKDPKFAKNYIKANKMFSKHAKMFRNNNITKMLKKFNPEEALKEFDTVKGIQEMKAILTKTPQGKELFEDLSRLKLDEVIGKNMVDSTTNQIKFGTFSKLLEKGKNRDVIKELLPKTAYKRLQRLQKVSGRLAESAQKFFNASKSGVTLEDAGIVSKVLLDIGNLLNGNPWPLMKTGAGITGMRYITRLMGDPEFLRLVEDILSTTNNNNIPLMLKLAQELAPKVKAAIDNSRANQDKKGNNRQKNLPKV